MNMPNRLPEPGADVCERCGQVITSARRYFMALGLDLITGTRRHERMLIPAAAWHAYTVHHDIIPLWKLLLTDSCLTPGERARLRRAFHKIGDVRSVYAHRRAHAKRLGGRAGLQAERKLQAQYPRGIPQYYSVERVILDCPEALAYWKKRNDKYLARMDKWLTALEAKRPATLAYTGPGIFNEAFARTFNGA